FIKKQGKNFLELDSRGKRTALREETDTGVLAGLLKDVAGYIETEEKTRQKKDGGKNLTQTVERWAKSRGLDADAVGPSVLLIVDPDYQAAAREVVDMEDGGLRSMIMDPKVFRALPGARSMADITMKIEGRSGTDLTGAFGDAVQRMNPGLLENQATADIISLLADMNAARPAEKKGSPLRGRITAEYDKSLLAGLWDGLGKGLQKNPLYWYEKLLASRVLKTMPELETGLREALPELREIYNNPALTGDQRSIEAMSMLERRFFEGTDFSLDSKGLISFVLDPRQALAALNGDETRDTIFAQLTNLQFGEADMEEDISARLKAQGVSENVTRAVRGVMPAIMANKAAQVLSLGGMNWTEEDTLQMEKFLEQGGISGIGIVKQESSLLVFQTGRALRLTEKDSLEKSIEPVVRGADTSLILSLADTSRQGGENDLILSLQKQGAPYVRR
ncbi:MAG TPA: hypothetical protein VJC03_00435, partial [bacterium]|nr:hypothetical protein [bacterium]